MIILKLIKSLKYPHSITIPMYPSISFHHILYIIGLEIGVPKVVFKLLGIGVFRFIEGFYYLDCLHVCECGLLTFHLVHQEFYQLQLPEDYCTVKAPEYRSHPELSSVSVDEHLQVRPY